MSDFHLKIFWPLRVTKWPVFDEFFRVFFSKWTIFGGESKFCLNEVQNWSGPPKNSMCTSDSSQWFSVKDLLNVHDWLIWVIFSWKSAPRVWGTHMKDFQGSAWESNQGRWIRNPMCYTLCYTTCRQGGEMISQIIFQVDFCQVGPKISPCLRIMLTSAVLISSMIHSFIIHSSSSLKSRIYRA